MKYVSQKKGLLIFLGFDLALLLVMFIALLPFIRQKSAPDMQETAMLNPKYASQVHSIKFSLQDDSLDLFHKHTLTLINADGMWVGGDSLNDDVVWPADSTCVNNFISLASTVTTMYKRSDRVTSWKDFGLEDDEALCVTFLGEGDTILSELYFGREDTLTQRIAMRTSARGTVWDTPSDISTYLTLNTSFWADPYIFPLMVTGLSSSEAASSLRRGLLQQSLCEGESDFVLQRDFSGGTELVLSFYKQTDGSYLVNAVCRAGPAASAYQKKILETVRYSYSISAWTYQRILEEE